MSWGQLALIYAKDHGYTCTEDGVVFSPYGRMLQLHERKDGYLAFGVQIVLSDKTKRVQILLHRFLAYLKFGSAIFEAGIEVRHLDNDKQNNVWWNIELGTRSENMRDVAPKLRRDRAQQAALRREWDRAVHPR